MKLHRFIGAALLAVVGFTTPANGAVIQVGTLNLAGDVIVTATQLQWQQNLNGDTADFIILPSTSGMFNYLDNTFGYAADLDSTQQTVDGLPGPFQVIDFLSFQADPALKFTLTGVEACTFCLAPLTPLNFIQTGANSTTVTLNLRGDVFNGAVLVGTYTGTWSADFTESLASLLARFNQTGSLLAPYSAATVVVTQAVPEPVTLGLLGFGLFGFAASRRRRQ